MDFTVIALGGSVVVPEEIDVSYLRSFREFVLKEIGKGRRFLIVVGGGKTSRVYQRAVSSIADIPNEHLDWIGIYSSLLNAHLLKVIFGDEAHPFVIDREVSKEELARSEKSVFIASGWSPGCSTDYVAISLAITTSSKTVIVASDTPFVYEEDPKKNGNAKELIELGWEDYNKMVPDDWSPGLSLPIDPIATQLGAKEKVRVKILDGRDLKNMRLAIEDATFRGTTIS